MHRLAHDVVDTGGVKAEGVVERGALAQAQHRRLGALADQLRKMIASLTISDPKGLYRLDVSVAGLLKPLAELDRVDARRGHAFAIEAGRISPVTMFRSSTIMNMSSRLIVLASTWLGSRWARGSLGFAPASKAECRRRGLTLGGSVDCRLRCVGGNTTQGC